MIPALTLLIIILTSLLVVRTGAVALTMTGLSSDVANFQAQSAFMGVGFTTSEAETVAGHPVRRKIIRLLMLLGYVGLGSGLATVVTTFAGAGEANVTKKVVIIIAGLAVLLLLTSLGLFSRVLNRVIYRALSKASTLQIHDYEELLRLDKGFSISAVLVEPDSWLDGRSLRELKLNAEGILVLNLSRTEGTVLTTPRPDTTINAGDKLLCYGLEEDLTQLTSRPAGAEGEADHRKAVGKRRGRQSVEATEDLQARLEADEETPEESPEEASTP